MVDSRGTSRQSSRRGSQRSKIPLRSSPMSYKSKSATSRNRQHSSRPTREDIKPQSQSAALPSDVWTRLLPFLTWRDTTTMRCVSSEWRRVVNEAKKLHPEWRSTVLGPSVNGSESLELLKTNHLGWADTRFAPDLVLLTAASREPSPWHSGGYWEEAIAAIEGARLLSPRCRIVAVFTMNAVLGRASDVETEDDSSAVILSISVAHLPETTLEMEIFDRKELRRCQRGVELDNPFTVLKEDESPSFMLFGVNDQSASQLVSVVERWNPQATVVGAVSPLMDRCVPLATYLSGVTVPVDHQKRKTRKHKHQTVSRRRPRPQSQVVFPSTMLLRLHGNVSIKSFSSSGYYPITSVIRCERASVAEALSQVVTYDFVSMLSHDTSTEVPPQHRVMDLLEPAQRFAIEQEGRPLNIFSCADSAPLEHLFECCKTTEPPLPIAMTQINRLEFVFWLQDALMSLPGCYWQEGAYGILASHHPTRTSQALIEALRRTKRALSVANERAFGAFLAVGALNEVEDVAHLNEVNQLCNDVFQELQLGGCMVSSSIGPVAFPGLQPPIVTNVAKLQTHTTCGAIFYTKA